MNKTKKFIVNVNESVVDVLKQNISKNLNFGDQLVETNKLYGIFLSNNEFVICKEDSSIINSNASEISLFNFFTNEIITKILAYDYDELPFPFGNKKIFDIDEGVEAIGFPISFFLKNHCKNGVTTKKNLIVVFHIVNQYLKENQTFINDLFKEIEFSKHI